jgi:hypothetical protein
MRARVVLVVAVMSAGLAACGSAADVGSGSTSTVSSSSAPATTTTLADAADSDYLGKVTANQLRGAAMVPTEAGLVVLGGAAEAYERPLAPV